MKKLAIFVEGQTEQIFVNRLLAAIAGQRRVRIENRRAFGGSSSPRSLELIEARAEDDAEAQFFVLIVDCTSDGRVASDIRDNASNLADSGYTSIIGLRDVSPVESSQTERLRSGLISSQESTSSIEILFVLAVMELEAWFLAEHTHFPRIHSALTNERILAELGFDPAVDDMQLRPNPSQDLSSAYWLVQLLYEKRKAQALRTIDCLDIARVCGELVDKFIDLRNLVDKLERFLTN